MNKCTSKNLFPGIQECINMKCDAGLVKHALQSTSQLTVLKRLHGSLTVIRTSGGMSQAHNVFISMKVSCYAYFELLIKIQVMDNLIEVAVIFFSMEVDM